MAGILIKLSPMDPTVRAASSPMRMPVWRSNSTTAAIRMSSRQASRRARYSMRVKIRGALVSNLGWVMAEATLLSICLLIIRKR